MGKKLTRRARGEFIIFAGGDYVIFITPSNRAQIFATA